MLIVAIFYSDADFNAGGTVLRGFVIPHLATDHEEDLSCEEKQRDLHVPVVISRYLELHKVVKCEKIGIKIRETARETRKRCTRRDDEDNPVSVKGCR